MPSKPWDSKVGELIRDPEMAAEYVRDALDPEGFDFDYLLLVIKQVLDTHEGK